MADTKNFGLKGVGNDIQLGKAGSRINLSGGAIQARNAADGAFVIVKALTPVANEDLATKLYVDNVAAGLDTKESCQAATTGDILGTYATSPSNGQITGVAATIDGVTLATGDRVLVKNQSIATQNGIYEVQATATTLTRASDHDGSPANEVSAGNFTFVEAGTANADTGWVLQGDGQLTLNTDNLDWVQFSGTGTILAGTGLTKTGSTIDLDFVGGTGMTNTVATAVGDFIAFSDTSVSDTMQLRSWTNILADLDIVNGGGNGILTRTGPDAYTGRTITASATASEEGMVIANGDGTGGNPTIGLDIQGTTSAGTNAVDTDEIILFDGTNNRAYSITELSAAPAFDSAGTSIADADGDTQIQTEEGADEDIIRFDTGNNVTGYPANANALIFSSGQFTLALPTADVATTVGGAISLTGGIGNTTGNGGAVSFTSGNGGATGNGGLVTILAGNSGAGATGAGGAIVVTGGTSVATNGAGGDVTITSGAGNGSGADGDIIIVAGVVEAVRYIGDGADVIKSSNANVGLTADVGSAQGNGVITSSYNVYTVVATAGDAATLPATFAVGTQIFVKNDDATESMDVFPASGDDAGNGTNNAVAVPAGQSATFLATAADATWTKLIAPPAAGTGTVTSSGTPLNNEVAVFTSGTDIDSTSTFTWDATTLVVNELSFAGDTISNNTADQPLILRPNGTGSIIFQNGSSEEILELLDIGSAVNGLSITPGITGTAGPQIGIGTGGEANVDIGFVTAGTGVLSVAGGAGTYEDNVTAPDDIPNKQYVDDAIQTVGGSGSLDSVTADISLAAPGTFAIGAATGIPANCTILSTIVDITTLTDTAVTVTVGDATNGVASYMAASENDPEAADIYVADGRVLNGGTARQANAIVGGVDGTVGNATIIITFRHV